MELNDRHQCLIYEGSPSRQLPAMAATLQRKLGEGYRCLYLNSAFMVAGLRSALTAIGFDVVDEVARGRLVLSSELVPGDGFDVEFMLQLLEDAVLQAKRDGYKGLFATGDMAFEFGAEKNFARLMEYEYKLEQLMRKHPSLCGICQYDKATLPLDVPRQALLTHRSIFVNETVWLANPYFVPAEGNDAKLVSVAELNEMIASLCEAQLKKG